MPLSDIERVLRGCALVATQVVKMQGPEVSTRARATAAHVIDLAQRVSQAAAASAQHAASKAEAMHAEAPRDCPRGPEAGFSADPLSHNSSRPFDSEDDVDRDLAGSVPERSTTGFASPGARLAGESLAVRGDDGAAGPAPSIETFEGIGSEHDAAPPRAGGPAEPRRPLPPHGGDAPPRRPPTFHERAVPASPLARVFGFGTLAMGLAAGTVAEGVRRTLGVSDAAAGAGVVMSEANAERLASTLCRMRGAALKLGQMLSIADDSVVPPVVQEVLERVRQSADIMPKHQLHSALSAAFGPDWRDLVAEFDDTPMAAASIGQVHRAVMHDGRVVAMKVQYPGVARSIDSDLDNAKRVLILGDLLPRGLYIDKIVDVAREELKRECDYRIEAANQQRFRSLVGDDSVLHVPQVIPELSTESVLTTELIAGVPIDQVTHLSQDVRNSIARHLLRLTLHELFVWRFMQTDPNWGNFFYDERSGRLHLLDFGAAREYPKAFVDDYLRLVWAAAEDDRDGIIKHSLSLGLITGHESPEMLEAHIAAGMAVGEPFQSYERFDFHASGITSRVARHGDTFAHHRLTPPPDEIYSLHRKLAGAFFICIRMGAVMSCRDMLEEVYYSHDFSTPAPENSGEDAEDEAAEDAR